MAEAKAAISSTVSPRIRMAVTAAATWDGVGSPRRQAAKKSCACSDVSGRPSTSRARIGLNPSAIVNPPRSGGREALHAGDVEEVGQHVVAVFGGDRFRVELHAVDRAAAVPKAHDLGRRRSRR